jgi:hypothetical protein
MASTINFDAIDHEAEAREFAAEFGHLPSVQRTIALSEAGRIEWRDAYEIFRAALAKGLCAAYGSEM